MHLDEHSHCFMHFLASEHCLGRVSHRLSCIRVTGRGASRTPTPTRWDSEHISESPRGATVPAHAGGSSPGRAASRASAPAGWGMSRAELASPASLARRACSSRKRETPSAEIARLRAPPIPDTHCNRARLKAEENVSQVPFGTGFYMRLLFTNVN